MGKPRHDEWTTADDCGENLGHADTKMVERFYGHLAPSYVADAIRANAPRFGFEPDPKIVVMP
jgi:hypothetical protein